MTTIAIGLMQSRMYLEFTTNVFGLSRGRLRKATTVMQKSATEREIEADQRAWRMR
jgi:hypothetical protein